MIDVSEHLPNSNMIGLATSKNSIIEQIKKNREKVWKPYRGNSGFDRQQSQSKEYTLQNRNTEASGSNINLDDLKEL